MKTLVAVVTLVSALAAFSQSSTQYDTMESQIRRGLLEGRDRNLIVVRTEKPNEIRNGRVSYNGILVQLVKTDNPLQLVNPAAPAEHGSSWDNVVINPNADNSGREGLKLFSINF